MYKFVFLLFSEYYIYFLFIIGKRYSLKIKLVIEM